MKKKQNKIEQHSPDDFNVKSDKTLGYQDGSAAEPRDTESYLPRTDIG